MYKLVQGKSAKQFGDVEWYLAVNWWNLITPLILASLAFFSQEVLPVLQDHNVLSAGVLGALGALIPIIQNYLRDNSKLTYQKPIDTLPKKG